MNFFAISGLLNGLAATALAVLIYTRAPRDRRHWSFALFGLTTAIWSYGYFAWQLSVQKDVALLFVRILMAGAIFIPVTFLHHVLVLQNLLPAKRTVLKLSYLIGTFFLLMDWTPLFVQTVRPTLSFPHWPVPGPLFHVFLLWWGGIVVYSHYLLGQAVLREKGIRRRQFGYLLLASSIGYAGGATNFPLWYGIELLPYGTICFTAYIALVAYALLRYHLMDFSVFVERGLSYLGVLFLISQPAFPILLLAQKSIFGSISVRFSVVQVAVHLLTVAGAYQLKVGTRGAIARTVMRGRELRFKRFSRFSSNVANSQDVDELGQEIVQSFREELHARTAVLYLLNHDANHYTPIAFYGEPVAIASFPQFSVTHELPRYLAIVQTELVRRELELFSADSWKLEVVQALEAMGMEVCLPFVTKNRLLGFCLLGPLSPDVTEPRRAVQLIAPLIQEAALSLENALLQDEVNRSHALVLHMDRLRSLETMAAGLAHELRAPLTSLKAFAQLAALRQNDEEFLSRFRAVISEDIERIEHLTKEIREYLEPSRFNPVLTDMNEMVSSCVSILSRNPAYRRCKVDLSLADQLPFVSVDRQCIKQAILNVLLDCLDKRESDEERILVRSHAVCGAVNGNWIQIEVLVDRDDPTNVATPHDPVAASTRSSFQEAMTEDGLALVAEIVQSHGGLFHIKRVAQARKLYILSLPEASAAQGESHSFQMRTNIRLVHKRVISESQDDQSFS